MSVRPETRQEEQVWELLQRLQARVDELENNRDLQSASIRGGALRILDDAGQEVIRVGKQASGAYGITILTDGGFEVMKVDQSGFTRPWVPIAVGFPGGANAWPAGVGAFPNTGLGFHEARFSMVSRYITFKEAWDPQGGTMSWEILALNNTKSTQAVIYSQSSVTVSGDQTVTIDLEATLPDGADSYGDELRLVWDVDRDAGGSDVLYRLDEPPVNRTLA